MKKTLLILTILSFSFGFSQTEKASYKSVASQFKRHYNNKNFERIFNMLTDDFQKSTTLENTKVYIKNQLKHKQLGNITSIKLEEIIRSGHNYILTLEKGKAEMFFLLDNENKIKGLQIYPLK